MSRSTPARVRASGGSGEQAPAPGTSCQLVLAALLEDDARAGDDVLDRARDEHLAGKGGRSDSRADVDRDSADAVVGLLDLAGVDAGSQLEAERREPKRRSPRRSERRGPGRRRSRPAPSPPVPTSRPRKRSTWARTTRSYRASSSLEASSPALASRDDVSEEQGGEDPVRLAGRCGAPRGTARSRRAAVQGRLPTAGGRCPAARPCARPGCARP